MPEVFLGTGSRVKHPDYGSGVVIQVWPDCYDIVFMEHGFKQVMHSDSKLEIVEFRSQDPDLVSFAKVEKILANMLRKMTDLQETVPLGERWKGGKMILKPGDDNLQSKEIPIETFFHKITMVRDRLRVMEQRVNSSKLDEEDKMNLQQYITRIYGSLTTFNVLFADKEDYFVGEKGGN
jgi:hypothetical protein